MPTYTYKGRDSTGKLIKGAMDAAAKQELVDKLHNLGYMITQVQEASAAVKIVSIFERVRGVSTQDMVMFNIQLSNMINSGISIIACLATLSRQLENKKLKDAVESVSRSVEAGEGLSQSFSRHPRIFPRLFVNMVKAGEASGKLGTVLRRYAEFIEHQADLQQKVRGALFYPAILLLAGIAVILFIVTTVIPQFGAIFLKVGIRLPLPTLILYQAGMAIKHYWFVFIILLAALITAVKFFAAAESGRLQIDKMKLRFPLFGPLFRKAAVSRFCRTLSTLISSGVPILQSLDIVKEVVANEVLARIIVGVRGSVERGQSISEPMKISEEFPADVVQMISTGEETGTLSEMLNKVSDFYDLSLDYTIKKLTTIIEPVLLVVMGAMVGFIMASLLLPIFDMIKVLRH
jgi:type IV pilus assembly protein PilC